MSKQSGLKITDIRAGAVVIGADGVVAGTVDRVEGDRIELKQNENISNSTSSPLRYVPTMFVDAIEEDKLLLSTRADAAVMIEDTKKAPSWQRRTDGARER
jgi:hypothetical protein